MTMRPVILAAALFCTACGMEGGARSPGFAAALPPAPIPAFTQATGAIFQPQLGYAGLHEGTRARRVGDVVTVLLVENFGSSKSASAQTGRDGSAAIMPPSAGPLSFLNPDALKAAAQGSFKGQGNAAQRSTLNGAVSVTIAELRANGTALVIGERQMNLSQGDEWVQFSGIHIGQTQDVDADNHVPSSRIADARIVHGGKGAIQQASRPGWLSRFFNMVSPF
jgi:flagellar L-ring protein FlgH